MHREPSNASGMSMSAPPHSHSHLHGPTVALLYGLCSVCAILLNKTVLSSSAYGLGCPNLLMLAQSLLAVAVLGAAHRAGVLSLSVSWPHCWKMFPVSLCNFAMIFLGLPALSLLSVPMYAVLKRSSMLFMVPLEWWLLRKFPSRNVVITLIIIFGGSCLSAIYDFNFNLAGYLFAVSSSFCQALSSTLVKSRGDNVSLFSMVYINSLWSIPLNSIGMTVMHEWQHASVFWGWTHLHFLISFLGAVCVGILLTYTQYLCIVVNSPITMSVTGAAKNVVTTLSGFLFFERVTPRFWNIAGLVVSFLGSVAYSGVKLVEQRQRPTHTPAPTLYGKDSGGQRSVASHAHSIPVASS